ncbi:MAG: hypothetical protein RIB67_07355 [Miltoncostaeaceae bacterium]
MAGNSRSGRRPSVETLLRDAGMSARLSIEACSRAKSSHDEQGRMIDAALQTAHEVLARADSALVEHRRLRTVRLAPEPQHDLREAA